MRISYLIVQLKRGSKHLPAVLLSTLLLFLSLGMLLFMIAEKTAAGDAGRKVNIGLVGNAKDSYLGIGLGVLNTMDSSRQSIHFIQMEEEEAKNSLRKGEIGGYVLVPEEFFAGLARGENIPLTYVSLGTSGSLGELLITEIADVAGSALLNSERAVYAMQDFVSKERGGERLSELNDRLNLRLISAVLNRNRIYDTEIYGLYERLSPELYYASGMLVLFLLLWGVNGVLLLKKEESDLKRLLRVRGCDAVSQILGEYLAFFFLMYAAVNLVLLLSGLFVRLSGIDLRDYGFDAPLPALLWAVLPTVAMLSALQFLIHEAVSDVISSVMASFFLSMGLGYLSGCFYPAGFFPESIRNTAVHLPAGLAMRYLQSCFTGGKAVGITAMCLYTLLFLGIAVLLRDRSLKS